VKTNLLEKCSRKSHSVKDIVLEEILNTYPDRVENPINTHLRCERFKSYLLDYLKLLTDDHHLPLDQEDSPP
jgi:hypothetical protein